MTVGRASMPRAHAHTFRAVSHPLRVFSGEDALAHLPAELARAGASRAVVLCGRTVQDRTDLIARLRSLLGPRLAGVYADLGAGAPQRQVEAAADAVAALAGDALIAIGAGSVTKAARVVAIRLAEDGPLDALATRYDANGRGTSTRLPAPKLPIFNVLTAATTSQNRAGASIRDEAANRQLEFFDPKTRPRAVFWDARVLLTAPRSLTRSAAGMEYWWGLMNLAGGSDENPLVLASRRQAWAIAQEAMPRMDDDTDWQVRVELCAAALLRTRDEDDGGVPLGVAPGSHEIRMHPVTRATYMLAQGLFNAGFGISQPGATMALAAPAVRAFGDLCPQVVADIGHLLGVADTSTAGVADALESRLRDFGFTLDLRAAGVSRESAAVVRAASLRTFNCNADGWMDDKQPRLQTMLDAVL
ncbi:iron-containing alcohol dehydrogenase [Thermomonas sp.]|uniref:iron-containing alcohol dehydrogenase n=1 Tax=Thermomonas sp. TaxID=1971895 RepID=UPI0024879D20|nr:iron-containing alcohol dehydrogenase [Thermomonas sp.]MDI1251618.1 iron-containing alcohol dehydrogenase [Thermomonas sp.]